MPELRKDPIVGRWVVIATERVRRPSDFPRHRLVRRGAPCMLCPGHERETPPEVFADRDAAHAARDTPGWRVRVVPSRFPALRIEGELARRGEGIYDLMNGIGAHEVIVESPDHERDLDALSIASVEAALRAYRARIADLRRDDRFRAVLLFKEHGADSAAILGHPHSQLIATPVVPLGVSEELEHARAYHDYRERCLFCDILRQETDGGARLVVESERIVAFSPFAARIPFETWLLPRHHAAAFDAADDAELHDLAGVLRDVLARLARALDDPPYQLVLHSAPFGASESPSYHWHFEILPRLGGGVASELGSGLHVNPVPPEDASRLLRSTSFP
jgi:UDPglucose--hexose-1-phosphate uridylyltransferase